ncbi:type 1 glutamine amidotransferase [Streptomyces sp. NPDC001970]
MTETDAVVWVADGLAAEGLDYGERLVERLTGQGLRVERRDLTTATADDIPGGRLHVLSGGSTSVNDASGWMPQGMAVTRLLVEAAQRGEHAVIGVCLGSQMIAEALWPGQGSVRAAGRIEVGLTEVRWREDERTDDGEQFVVPAFHYEELDPGPLLEGNAHVVADNGHSPVQGYRYGPRIWGVQFHPEFGPADVRRIVLHHRRTIETYHGDVRDALNSVDRYASSWSLAPFTRLVQHALQQA